MKKLMTTAAISAALLVATSSAIMAQDEETDTPKLSMGEITVKMGHSDEFRDGVAAWKACYLENNGESTWSTWQRMDGDSGSYYVNFNMSKWAEIDEDDAASEACSSVVDEQIAPHMKSSNWRWAEYMPDVSRNASPAGHDVALVYFFRVEDGQKFNSVVSEVVAAVREVEGDARGYWYEMYGGDEHAADYLIAITFENFAEWDEDEPPGVWAVAAEHYGEEKAAELRADFRASVDAVWDYTYRRIDELSHSAE